MTRSITCGGQPLTLIVLAGGESRRMGRHKALLRVPDETLINSVLKQVDQRFAEVLISVSKGQQFESLPYRTVEDDREGQGPLMGILCGLRASSNEVCVVLACDIPIVNLDLLKDLAAQAATHEIVVPMFRQGLVEPLFGVYRRSVVPRVESLMASGLRSILALFPLCRTHYAAVEDAAWYRNLNTPEDYAEYLRSLNRKAG